MSYAQIEMEIVRQLEATRGIDGDIEFDLEAIGDYTEALAWFNETDSQEKMAKMIGWIGISLLSMCATLDVNFVDCLEIAYQESNDHKKILDEEEED